MGVSGQILETPQGWQGRGPATRTPRPRLKSFTRAPRPHRDPSSPEPHHVSLRACKHPSLARSGRRVAAPRPGLAETPSRRTRESLKMPSRAESLKGETLAVPPASLWPSQQGQRLLAMLSCSIQTSRSRSIESQCTVTSASSGFGQPDCPDPVRGEDGLLIH